MAVVWHRFFGPKRMYGIIMYSRALFGLVLDKNELSHEMVSQAPPDHALVVHGSCSPLALAPALPHLFSRERT